MNLRIDIPGSIAMPKGEDQELAILIRVAKR